MAESRRFPPARAHSPRFPDAPSIGSGDPAEVAEMFLGEISDVTLTSPADRDALFWDDASGRWINSPIAQADVTDLVGDLALKAPLLSPALTGTPTAPTATPLTSTTQLATTKYVDDADLALKPYSADDIELATLGVLTPMTLQVMQDIVHSAGWVSGGAITDIGAGYIAVAAGTGLIRATDDSYATLSYCEWPVNTSILIDDLTQTWIYVDYNAGTPVIATTTVALTDFNTQIELGRVYRHGTDVHIFVGSRHTVADHASLMMQSMQSTMPFAHASGAAIGAVGTLGISVSEGVFWHGLTKITAPVGGFSTATGTFRYLYSNGGGGWTEVAAQTQINNTQYDDGTGTLATLTANRYNAHWVFLGADGDVHVLFGTNNALLAAVLDAEVPSVPPELVTDSRLIGKIIIQKSAATFYSISSAFTQTFAAAALTLLGSLSDVSASAPSDNNALLWNAATANWEPTAIATSDVTGLDTALGLKAPLASPTFSGTVTMPAGGTITAGVAPSADMNTVIIPGFYRVVTPMTNGPAGVAGYGQLIVSRRSDTIFQMYSQYNLNEVWTRSGNPTDVGGSGSPGWSAWLRLANTDDLALKATLASPSFTGTVGVGIGQLLVQFTNYMSMQTSDAGTGAQVFLGNSVDPTAYIYGSPIYFNVVGGATKWQMTAAGHLLAGADNVNDIGASGATRPRSLYLSTSISIGTTPAAAGNVRLPNNGYLTFRNAANSADITGLFVSTSNNLFLGGAAISGLIVSATTHSFYDPTTATLYASLSSTGLTVTGVAFAVGTTPATVGTLRIPNNGGLYSRNGANTANLSLLYLSTIDYLNLGGTSVVYNMYRAASGHRFFNASTSEEWGRIFKGYALFGYSALAAAQAVYLNNAAGYLKDINFQTGGVARWILRSDATAEAGSDAGSDFELLARGDSGSYTDSPLKIVRAASGLMTLARPTLFSSSIRLSGTTATWSSGTGSPESVLTAPVGSMWTRTDGGAGTTLYVKETGAGNTGWAAK